LPLRKVARAIWFLWVTGSTDQMSRAALSIALGEVRDIFHRAGYFAEGQYLHRLFAPA
jgi:hypothetical protein